MAVRASLPGLLESLTQSITSAFEASPKLAGIEPSKDGVSLLDTKNELLLSYLQNLVFLILIKIRNVKAKSPRSHDEEDDHEVLSEALIDKLVELRLYLEKGVRPLEEKLQFQLDKILRAVHDADRSAELKNGTGRLQNSRRDGSHSEPGSSDEDEGESDLGKTTKPGAPRSNADKQAAPGFNKFMAPANAVGMAAANEDKTGIYRPPKFAPTAMPTTERREPRDRRPMKSATIDEYISNELSNTPVAEPSIGTTIVAGGRKMKTAGERVEEDRRREYEETNYVRLPKESKKERTKRNKTEGRGSKMQFGGEDWRGLGEGVDRIERLTRRKDGGSVGTKALLEQSRKRGRDTTDGDRGSGLNSSTREIGDRFQKRLKVIQGGRRDRGKR